MLEVMAGAVMALKVHFHQLKYPFMKKQDRIVAETIYRNEVDKVGETEKYEKTLNFSRFSDFFLASAAASSYTVHCDFFEGSFFV